MKLNNIKNIVGGNNRNSPIGRFAKLPGGCAGISIVCKMIQYLNTRDILNLVESSFVKQLNKIYYGNSIAKYVTNCILEYKRKRLIPLIQKYFIKRYYPEWPSDEEDEADEEDEEVEEESTESYSSDNISEGSNVSELYDLAYDMEREYVVCQTREESIEKKRSFAKNIVSKSATDIYFSNNRPFDCAFFLAIEAAVKSQFEEVDIEDPFFEDPDDEILADDNLKDIKMFIQYYDPRIVKGKYVSFKKWINGRLKKHDGVVGRRDFDLYYSGPDFENKTPLGAAIYFEKIDVIKYLLNHGVEVADFIDEHGWNYLHLAAGRWDCNEEVIEILLNHLTPIEWTRMINREDNIGYTPLDCCYNYSGGYGSSLHLYSPNHEYQVRYRRRYIKRYNEPVVKLLREHGGRANNYDKKGRPVNRQYGDLFYAESEGGDYDRTKKKNFCTIM